MHKGSEAPINATMMWVLALIILLVIIMLVFFLRDRSINMILGTLRIPT